MKRFSRFMRAFQLLLFLAALAVGSSSLAFGPYGLHDPILDQHRLCNDVLHAPPVTPREKAEQMYRILTNIRKVPESHEIEGQIREALVEKFMVFMAAGKPVKMYIPCFPAKSPNHMVKTLGPLPDLAEEIALARIATVVDAMAAIYPTQFDLASDGRIFADTWWATDAEVDAYQHELRKLIPSPNIKIRDFDYYYPDLTPPTRSRPHHGPLCAYRRRGQRKL